MTFLQKTLASAFVGLGLLTSGCYNPQINDADFLCSINDPACPDGFQCVEPFRDGGTPKQCTLKSDCICVSDATINGGLTVAPAPSVPAAMSAVSAVPALAPAIERTAATTR